jgi:RNA polymerase sigma-70 factor (ECF subfamily)
VTGEPRPVPDEAPASLDAAAERALVNRACAGDQRAIETLYELHFDLVYRVVLGTVGNPVDAEDITGEVFIKMYEALPRYQWRGVPFKYWLIQIARNQTTSHFRRGTARPQRPIDDMDFEDTREGPEALVERKLTVSEVAAVVRKLPEAQRQVIELRFFANRSVAETAQVLKKSENNVKVLQHKAIQRLQKLLRDQ